jgi:hypothetical protein
MRPEPQHRLLQDTKAYHFFRERQLSGWMRREMVNNCKAESWQESWSLRGHEDLGRVDFAKGRAMVKGNPNANIGHFFVF